MKIFFSIIISLASSIAFGQIPNFSFENWTKVGTYNTPDNWGTMNPATAGQHIETATKGIPGNPGKFFLKLTCLKAGKTIISAVAVSGKLNTVTQEPISGFPFTMRPIALTGKWHYKINDASQGEVKAVLTKWNAVLSKRDTIGIAERTLTGRTTTWSNFNINFTYLSSDAPDSCIIELRAGGANAKKNDFLYIDKLSFSSPLVVLGKPLNIPDTLAWPDITLNLHKDSVPFFTGKQSSTYGFNSMSYLGPTLILKKGVNMNIAVNNQLDETTTLHWHGLHVPAKWDGGPHSMILPGTSWNPQFTVMDNAATYWYHPHPHMKTTIQTIKGAVGLIIVRDAVESSLKLPRSYGVDDFPIIVQSQQFDENNQIIPGMRDSMILVNGDRANYGLPVYANMPAQVVRMRLLNASSDRVINLGFSGNKEYYQIASDGGLLNTPYLTTRTRLAPGERAEILVNLSGLTNQTFFLMSYGSELPMGVQGGPTMLMFGVSMNSPLNGINYNIMQINVMPPTPNPVTTIPSTLTSNNPYLAAQANETRTIRFTEDPMPFSFNNTPYDMMRIDYQIAINNIEMWKLVNETMVAHPFHLHDAQFFVLDRNGNAPSPSEGGRKDVVLVPPGESLTFITKFEDFTDTVPYMYHCHILMHEDDGMMGQFIVTPLGTSINEQTINNDQFIIFPNPTTDLLTVSMKEVVSKNALIKIYDALGQKIYEETTIQEQTINISEWPSGIYTVTVNNDNNVSTLKFIVKH